MKTKKIAAIAGALILLSGVTAACSNDEPEATPPAVEETAAPEAEAPETETEAPGSEVSAEEQQAFTSARGTLAALLVQANVTAIATEGRVDEALTAVLAEAIATAEAVNESARGADDVVAATAELTAATEALQAAKDAADAAREQG